MGVCVKECEGPNTPQIFSYLVSTKGLVLITCLSLAVTVCFHFNVILIVPDYVYFFNKIFFVCLRVCGRVRNCVGVFGSVKKCLRA